MLNKAKNTICEKSEFTQLRLQSLRNPKFPLSFVKMPISFAKFSLATFSLKFRELFRKSERNFRTRFCCFKCRDPARTVVATTRNGGCRFFRGQGITNSRGWLKMHWPASPLA